MEQKKLPDREQFGINIESDILDKLVKQAKNRGIPLNTFINIILDEAIQKYL